jgi:heme/copper-type cytochrome/quinol oxidase subunit 3
VATVVATVQDRPGNLGIPNAVLGMLLFLATEVMFFAGLISAFLVVKARWIGAWPPPGQPRLPVEVTALNTLVLLASGLVLWMAARAAQGQQAPMERVRRLSLLAAALGAVFVLVQGVEWARLLAYGLTMRSGPYGSFFYLIVGTHAAHAVAAIVALVWASVRSSRGGIAPSSYRAVRLFWYFVVGVWPVLYVLVYLA